MYVDIVIMVVPDAEAQNRHHYHIVIYIRPNRARSAVLLKRDRMRTLSAWCRPMSFRKIDSSIT